MIKEKFQAFRKGIEDNRNIILIVMVTVIPLILIMCFTAHIITVRQKIILEEKVHFYETDCIREAEIIDVKAKGEGSVVYVNDYELGIIDVDVYWEGIHTTIEVGDTAVYTMDYERTDADLLTIIKKRV